MKLSQISGEKIEDDPLITGLTADSRAVRPGFLFAALKGTAVDGWDYVDQAIEQGAVAILGYPESPALKLPVIRDAEPRRRLAQMAARFFQKLPGFMAGITGTNGKTSTAQFAAQIWQMVQMCGGSLGTLGVHGSTYCDETGEQTQWHLPLRHTTPDPVTLHEALAGACDFGCTHMAMEVSSHGLDQYRADGVRFDVAAFTNITQDHLDYHKTFHRYLSAKKRLFTDLIKPNGKIIVNMDGAGAEALYNDLKSRSNSFIRTGKNGHDLRLTKVTPQPAGLSVEVVTAASEHFSLSVPLLGAFQAENALLAAAIVMASGVEAKRVLPFLENLKGVPGRMALAGQLRGGGIYVDYAHTPDAVETALNAARPHTSGRLIAIIGAGGNRDLSKRPLMGAAGAHHADIVILADDNPRHEDPEKIREEILQGAPDAINIGDRAKAIAYGAGLLQTGDVLMILGKGHETGQTIGERTVPFDDQDEVRKLVANG